MKTEGRGALYTIKQMIYQRLYQALSYLYTVRYKLTKIYKAITVYGIMLGSIKVASVMITKFDEAVNSIGTCKRI